MAFARVDDEEIGGARGVEHRLGRRDRALEQRDIVAERFAEAARLEEVALHVDDEQRRPRQVERHGLRFSLDRRLQKRLPGSAPEPKQQDRGQTSQRG